MTKFKVYDRVKSKKRPDAIGKILHVNKIDGVVRYAIQWPFDIPNWGELPTCGWSDNELEAYMNDRDDIEKELTEDLDREIEEEEDLDDEDEDEDDEDLDDDIDDQD